VKAEDVYVIEPVTFTEVMKRDEEASCHDNFKLKPKPAGI
jgi:hypothetical protein